MNIQRIQKRPVEVAGIILTEDNCNEVAEWCGGIVKRRGDNFAPSLQILTLEGAMTGQIGDWIIRGVNGEFYPCKANIFDKTYDVLTGERAVSDNGSIVVDSIIEHDDGSATVNFEMDQASLHIFAKIGLKKALIDAAEEVLGEERE